jgi:hypothetical protein
MEPLSESKVNSERPSLAKSKSLSRGQSSSKAKEAPVLENVPEEIPEIVTTETPIQNGPGQKGKGGPSGHERRSPGSSGEEH